MYGAVPKRPACVLKRICGGTGVMISSVLLALLALWFASLNTFLGAMYHSQNHMLVLANLLVFTVVLYGQSYPEETFIQDGQEEIFPYKR